MLAAAALTIGLAVWLLWVWQGWDAGRGGGLDEAVTSGPAVPATASTTTSAPPIGGSCSVANALAAAGKTDRAERAYQSVLDLNPLSECAAAGLLALRAEEEQPAPRPPNPCDVARELHAAGSDDEAKKVLVEAVKAGTSDCAAATLDEISEPSVPERAGAGVAAFATLAPFAALIALGRWPHGHSSVGSAGADSGGYGRPVSPFPRLRIPAQSLSREPRSQP